MAEPPSSDSGGDNSDDAGVGPDRNVPSGPPRWVKVFGIIAVVVLVLFVIILLAGGHNPGRHRGSGPGGHAPPLGMESHGGQ